MPQNKKQDLLLSLIMSLLMIYIMAALNMNVRIGGFATESWIIALQRLPLGYVVGIICDLCICTPIARKVVAAVTEPEDRTIYKVLVLRFAMVILMTVAMTVFSVFASGLTGMEGVIDFFKYLPYNFTIALPIQMIIIALLSLRIAKILAPVK